MNRFEFIGSMVKKFNWTLGAEVGVWKGDTLFYLLDRFPKLCMIGVDQWKIYEGFGDKESTGYIDYRKKKENIEGIKKRVLIQSEKYNGRANVMAMPSLDASEHIEDDSLDFVFIDSDHRTSFVRADIAAWFPKIKKKGIMFGHDWNIKSVRIALLSLNQHMLSLVELDHVWLMEKN